MTYTLNYQHPHTHPAASVVWVRVVWVSNATGSDVTFSIFVLKH
jgi:hypothetical protein